ncbi:MAG: phosphoesterase [Bacteroidota bacterium]
MRKIILSLFIFLLVFGCATKKTKERTSQRLEKPLLTENPIHSFLVFGNMDGKNGLDMGEVLAKRNGLKSNFKEHTTVLFLGNSFTAQSSKKQKASKEVLKAQVGTYAELLKNNHEDAVFLPGNSEWGNGVDWLENIEKEVDDSFGKNSFLPEKGCPLDSKKINEQLILVTVDSQWFLNDWDEHPKINDNCDIKDREKFFAEFESLVKKNVDKIMIVAMHHPVFSNGNYGGQYSLGQNLIPLPVLGSLKTLLKKTGGISEDHLQNEAYRSFRKRMVTLSRFNERVIFVSAHEHNLQHIYEDDIHQVISGAMVNGRPVRLGDNGLFASGELGHAAINVYNNGKTEVNFFNVKGELIHNGIMFNRENSHEKLVDERNFPPDTIATIYEPEDTKKSSFHKWFWGNRYRKYYARPIAVPMVDLDTLMGGMTILRKGGGHQSKSLRLQSAAGREYVMRALEKSAEAYLQAIVSKEEYIIGKVKGTAAERILKDIYTGSHPYAPLVVGKLAEAIDIYHTNPILCFVPKQSLLGKYNMEFGDKLYMIEERVTDGHGNQKSFGNANKIISTDDLISRLASDEKFEVDLDMYIRARLFDMLLGDWDRHDDQWRWGEFKDQKPGKIVYRPIPRDRDQVFSIMGDGFFMGLFTRAIPSLRLMEGFDTKIRSVKGFSSSPKTFSLDMFLLPETTEQQWIKAAKEIQEKIDEGVIDTALGLFPKEVQDETNTGIKNALLTRKDDLVATAKRYFGIINKISVVIGTDKDDYFVIEDIGDGKTKIEVFRILAGKRERKFFSKVYNRETTKEVWLYGLDDDDVFKLVGKGRRGPKIRLIGGPNNDVYDMDKRSGVSMYDYKSKKNTFTSTHGKVRLTDDYDINTYNPFKVKEDQNLFLPFLGYNPDDGIQLTASNTYTHNGFIKEPFTSKHKFDAGFYFATSGFDFSYQGDFVRFVGKAALRINVALTSPNFTQNFFGFGNETPNFDDDQDLDFNRVKIESIKVVPSLVWNGKFGSQFSIGASYEGIRVEETDNRFIETFYTANPQINNENSFLGIQASYAYENLNSKAFPTLGMTFSLKSGYQRNVTNGDDDFSYVVPEFSFNYPILPSGGIVVTSRLGGQVNFGNGFQFFQGASIGAENGLRGYRFQRFTGKRSFYQSSDLKIVVKSIKTNIVPLYLGLYGGFDYGRVWVENDDSNIWNTSYGGGVFVNGIGVVTLQAGLFNSADGNRLSVGLSVGF